MSRFSKIVQVTVVTQRAPYGIEQEQRASLEVFMFWKRCSVESVAFGTLLVLISDALVEGAGDRGAEGGEKLES